MLNDIRASWALFVGIAFIMLGNGLQSSLLGLRASMENFPTLIIGFVMAGYFFGILVGSILAPKLVQRVGHIRVFGALSSLASISILAHGLFINPIFWTLMRFVTGVCYAGVYVISESWLNDRASNQTRGKILSLYMLVVSLAMGGGQLLLNIADPAKIDLFILVSVVISVGLIPMLLTARPAPAFEMSSKMTLRELYRASPLAVVGNALTGVAQGTLFGLGAVYAKQSGFSVAEISIFMAFFTLGGVIFQWPIGLLSDHLDRRRVLLTVAALATILAVLIPLFPNHGLVFLVFVLLLGGMIIPMYSLCIAYANDRLQPNEMVAASASLVMVSGFGLSTGPILISYFMSSAGLNSFFYGISLAFALLVLFGLYQMRKRAPVDCDEQNPVISAGQIGTPIAEFVTPDMEDYVEAISSGDIEQLEQLDQQDEDDLERRL
ncbi:MAG TPA: MFS transporter [Gammaproteobacteria bacterium]|nr:MFS transporter [Gammaproteobacteria bacterium]